MQSRRISLKIKFDHLGRILVDLGIIETKVRFNSTDNTFELRIEKEETSDLFKKLSTDPGIVSWEFDEGVEKEEYEEITVKEEEIEEKKYFTNFNDAATFIEAAWKLSKKSPAIIFGTGLFNSEIDTMYNSVASSEITVEHALLTMILQNYYSGEIDYEAAYDDIIKKLKDEWKTLGQHPSLASLSKIWK